MDYKKLKQEYIAKNKPKFGQTSAVPASNFGKAVAERAAARTAAPGVAKSTLGTLAQSVMKYPRYARIR